MREFIRHPSDIPIEFSLVKTDSVGPMHNISRGGLSFTSGRAVAVGELLLIRIPGKDFTARARVAWCRPVAAEERVDDAPAFDIGVSFVEQDDAFAMRMIEQVCRIEQYREEVREKEGRIISSAEAAEEWIKRYADQFPNDRPKH